MHAHAYILIWDTHTCMGHGIVPEVYGPLYTFGVEHIQALMLDMVGPTSEVLKQLNMATESDLEKIELALEKFGSTLEALTF